MILRALVLSCLCPTLAGAQVWSCLGSDPDWMLEIADDAATFTFPGPVEMDVVQQNTAEGRDWPRAMTLIGGRDTGIVVVEPLACTDPTGDYPYRALILTQRGQTPILLSGCCRAPE